MFVAVDISGYKKQKRGSGNNRVYCSLNTTVPGTVLSVCVIIPFILDLRLVDAPAGVTQEGGHTGFLHLPCAVLASIFIARRIQPFLSLVDREVECCVPTN